MRTIAQPGPAPSERIQWVEARGRPVAFTLEPGLSLLEAVRRGLAEAGCESGALRLDGGAFGPFAYVMPALAQTPEHAAFYSAVQRPAAPSRLQSGAITFGTRAGAPFFHCHALWTEGERLHGGHVLPESTGIAEPIQASGIGLVGAGFVAEPDPETNFTLFGPVSRPGSLGSGDRRVFALRLRPNQDLSECLETFCCQRGVASARIHGGVGSIIGARFSDGRTVEAFATEMAIVSGRVAPGPQNRLEASVNAALVDYTGAVSAGLLVRGDNPVLMTMELVLEAE